MIFIYITAGSAKDAKKISRHLLEKKLIACTNIHPIESMYWWKGEIQENTEFVVIAKTVEKNYQKIEKEIKNIHTYETPCVCSWKIQKTNQEFKNWVEEETK